jgi:hypothetical protein
LVGAAGFMPLPESPILSDGVDAGCNDGAGAAAGTWNGCLHDGHCTRLPAALSGTCIGLPHAAFGHLRIKGIVMTFVNSSRAKAQRRLHASYFSLRLCAFA